MNDDGVSLGAEQPEISPRLQEVVRSYDVPTGQMVREGFEREVSRLLPILALTPRSRDTLRTAEERAVELGHDYLGTEHLLLALLDDSEGVAGQVLQELGAIDAIRERILEVVTSSLYLASSHLTYDLEASE